MIQFNLLPDVKINYLKARSLKRRILSLSMVVMAASIGLVTFIFLVQLSQKKNIKDLTADINREKTAIQANEDISKILTIQNQLNTLPGLHSEKPLTSRMFDYIGKLTPVDVSLGQLEVDVATTTMTVSGSAPAIEAINRYADTLKFATYKTESGLEGKPFSSVATTLSRSAQSTSFTLTVIFDPVILSAKEQVTLSVPQITTTRSETEKPTQLFQQTEGEN